VPTLGDLTAEVVLYAVLSLTLVRIVPVGLAMLGSGAGRATVASLGWFGPRGLASFVFAVVPAPRPSAQAIVCLENRQQLAGTRWVHHLEHARAHTGTTDMPRRFDLQERVTASAQPCPPVPPLDLHGKEGGQRFESVRGLCKSAAVGAFVVEHVLDLQYAVGKELFMELSGRERTRPRDAVRVNSHSSHPAHVG
jgi:hypothetical protein